MLYLIAENFGRLESKEQRFTWEKTFNERLMLPFLQVSDISALLEYTGERNMLHLFLEPFNQSTHMTLKQVSYAANRTKIFEQCVRMFVPI